MLGKYTPGRFNKFTKTFEKLQPLPCKLIEYLDGDKVKIKVLCFFNNEPNPELIVKRSYVKFEEEKQIINYYEPCQKN